jgi:molybdopterin molybdotransferase
MQEIPSMLGVEEALERILASVYPLPAEAVRVEESLGRAAIRGIPGQRTVPPWDNSAMDGFAVRSKDVSRAPVRLRVLETIYAGRLPTLPIGAGECSQIMTGAPMPSGADAVAMQEKTQRASATEVEIREPVSAGSFVRARGEDVREGDILLAQGSAIGLAEAALLWSQGYAEVEVARRPRVAVLSTGDELTTVEEADPGKLVDSNSPALAAAVTRCGGTATLLGIARDSPEALAQKLLLTDGFDIVLTSGGVSVGARDYVRDALAAAGAEMSFWKVAIKPGKPLAFGRRGATLFFGLPGNPTSSLVSFELFVRPALRKMQGHAALVAPRAHGYCEVEIHKPPGLTHFVRASARWRDGKLWARPLENQSSGALRSMVGATHLIVIPPSMTRVSAGAPVMLHPLSWQS